MHTGSSASPMLAGVSRPATDAQESIAVLIVDDDPMVLGTLSKLLQSEKIEVLPVSSSQKALAMVRERPDVSVVITDINMPGLDGLELAGRLKEERAESDALEVIIITGKPTAENAAGAVRRHVFDFLPKPFRGPAITAAVRRAHEAARVRRSRADRLRRLEDQMRSADEQRQQLHGLLRASRDELESALRSTDKTRREVIAVVSHELRTPLIPILGFSEILLETPEPDSETVHRYASKINAAGREMLRLVETMLDLLEWDTGTPRLVIETAAASAIVERAITYVTRRTPSVTAQRFRISGRPDLRVSADIRRLAEALGNLIDNSVKASPEGEMVDVIWSSPCGGMVEFRISDRGAGIPDAMIRDLGVPILQDDMSSSRRWPGLGLGLAVTSRVIGGHDGTLVLRRRDPEPGTEAVVTLPAAPGGAAS